MTNNNVQANSLTEIELTDEQLESICGGCDDHQHDEYNDHDEYNEHHQQGWYDDHHRWHSGQRHGYWDKYHRWQWYN
jgi:hypothetical protein